MPTVEHSTSAPVNASAPMVALLTGGGDRPYALGLAGALRARGVTFDFIGSDFLRSPDLEGDTLVRFLNLRGNQDPTSPIPKKAFRLLLYYLRLIAYAANSRAPIFHLLWNNKFETFDRTLLTFYYKILRKRLVLTVHNVNIAQRDGKDTWINRLTLRIHYRLVDHIFVHTAQMKRELQRDFHVADAKVSIIPFGINNTTPNTSLTPAQARQALGLLSTDRVLLFFGNIAPYKGLEYLIEAVTRLTATGHSYRVIIAGKPKGAESYWLEIQRRITEAGLDGCVIQRIEYISDEDTELFFKAADVFVLPYIHVFQSGVLFLGYNFGLPVIASDVGSLRDEIEEGSTGHVCEARNSAQLALCIERHFSSSLYLNLPTHRHAIREYAYKRHSWSEVGEITHNIYKLVSPQTLS